MDANTLCQYIVDNFPGTDVLEANGDQFFLHDPDRDLPDVRRMPWATLVTSDVNDSASNLDRPGVFRLSIGLTKADFHTEIPAAGKHDSTAVDVFMPHPVYGAQCWACVLNPDTTWPTVQVLLERAHELAARKYANAAARRRR